MDSFYGKIIDIKDNQDNMLVNVNEGELNEKEL